MSKVEQFFLLSIRRNQRFFICKEETPQVGLFCFSFEHKQALKNTALIRQCLTLGWKGGNKKNDFRS